MDKENRHVVFVRGFGDIPLDDIIAFGINILPECVAILLSTPQHRVDPEADFVPSICSLQPKAPETKLEVKLRIKDFPNLIVLANLFLEGLRLQLGGRRELPASIQGLMQTSDGVVFTLEPWTS